MAIVTAVSATFLLAALAPWLGRVLGKASGWTFATVPAAIAAWLAANAPTILAGAPLEGRLAWAPSLGLELAFSIDGLGLLFGLLISGVGALVLVYAGAYLGTHRHANRLQAFLLVFMGAMLGVVWSENLLGLFVFWELTSISSYLLIGFDHERLAARKAALQALLVTGGGGLCLLVAILMLGAIGGTYDLPGLLAQREAILESPWIGAIVVLVCLGAFTKSAQFPFHFWLPGAMEAPTPVSAYLHSSTMVKAGIFLLARLDPLLGAAAWWGPLLTAFGAVTMVLGAVLAMRQTHLKRILAYSTVSSLGIVTMALGIGTEKAVVAAFAYLLAHALFKGSLFMVAGAIDHGCGEKDTERLGGLRRAMPALFAASLLATLSMAGLPPLLGFIGKELLLEATLAAPVWNTALVVATTFAAALTVAVAWLAGVKPFLGAVADTPRTPHAPSPGLLLGPGLLAMLGLAAAIVPAAAATPLSLGAAAAVLEGVPEKSLALWHGLTPALGLSGLAVVVGAGAYAGRHAVRRGLERLGGLDRIGPERVYDALLRGLLAFAGGQTRVVQSGHLRAYVFITLGTVVLLVGGTLWLRGTVPLDAGPENPTWQEILVGAVIAAGAVATVLSRTRLAAIAALGLAGYGVAIMFVLFGGPDLAMTQLSVETLTVILFVLIFRRLPQFRTFSTPLQRGADALVALIAGFMVTGLVLVIARTETDPTLARWFGEHSVPDGYGRNVVNVILVDFRAMDTLGEITVLAIAAIGVLALLRPGRMRTSRRRRAAP
ncbi:MAG: putative monovalent cation/H+ antiporter subunit A [Planctomycetota bacterium]